MPKIKSYGIIVFRREGDEILFLLLKNAKWGHWDFPKGHPDAGEDELGAALRETREETGLTDLNVIPGFRESIRYHVDIEGERPEKGMKEAVYFLAEAPGSGASSECEVKISHEHTDHRWLSLAEALPMVQFDNARTMLAKAHDFLTKHPE